MSLIPDLKFGRCWRYKDTYKGSQKVAFRLAWQNMQEWQVSPADYELARLGAGGRQARGWDFNRDFIFGSPCERIGNTFTMEIALQELHSCSQELRSSIFHCECICLSLVLKCVVSIWAFFHLFFSLPKWAKMCTNHLGNILHHLVSVLSLFSAANGIVWKVWGDEEKKSFERGFTSFHHKGKYSMGTFVVLWYWSNCPESSDLELC